MTVEKYCKKTKKVLFKIQIYKMNTVKKIIESLTVIIDRDKDTGKESISDDADGHSTDSIVPAGVKEILSLDLSIVNFYQSSGSKSSFPTPHRGHS